MPTGGPGVHRDYLRNVKDAAAADTEVFLDQSQPDDDLLRSLGKPPMRILVASLQVARATPFQWVP